MDEKQNFYDLIWPNSRKFGMAIGTRLKIIKLIPESGKIENWIPVEFILNGGDYADYQANNFAFPMCSEKMRKIIDNNKGQSDSIQWLEALVKSNSESKKYYILHFPEKLDAIDKERSILSFLSEELSQKSQMEFSVIRPFLDKSKIEGHNIFSFKGGGSLTLVINEQTKKDLIKEKCTCIYYSQVPTDPETDEYIIQFPMNL